MKASQSMLVNPSGEQLSGAGGSLMLKREVYMYRYCLKKMVICRDSLIEKATAD